MELPKQPMAPDLSLLQQLSPSKRVILWGHDGPLDRTTPGLFTMDYLLDGLIMGHMRENIEEPLHHVLFSHPQFGKSMWIAFVNLKQVKPSSFLSELEAVLPPEAKSEIAIYSVEPLSKEWTKSISEIFTEVNQIPVK